MFRSPLGKALWGVRRTVLIAAFFSLAINLLMLTAPIYMLQVFDRVLQSRSLDTLFVLSIAALFALLILAALEMVRSFLFIRLAAWLDELLGPEILSGSITQALNRQNAPNAQCLRDILTVRNFLTSPAMGSFLDAPWTPLFLLVIFSLHAMLGWVSLIGAVILLAMAFANETTTRQLLLRAGMSNFQSEALAVASVRNADVVEAMGMRSGLISLWGRERRQAGLVQGQANSRGAIILATSKFFRFSLQIAILGVGAYLVLQDELSAGGMIAASILMGRALAPVDAAIAAWRNAVAAGAAAKRMRHQLRVTAAGARQDLAIELPTPRGLLQVNDLVFGYPGQREMVVKELSFDVKPGEILGIIGPSAVGKTTLARLIVGNLTPSMGDIRLDGIALSAWAANDKGQYLGYVPQDVELFMGSVQLNIARMGPVDRDAVIAAAQAAGIHEMILAFEQGYDTEIGEAGAVLSGGQRQRIALARALYGGPKLLIYDEPNSSLDHIGDNAFTDAITGLKAQGAAQVIISHKPGILRQTDKILILANGTAQAYGPRDQIIGGILRAQNRPDDPLTIGENGNG